MWVYETEGDWILSQTKKGRGNGYQPDSGQILIGLLRDVLVWGSSTKSLEPTSESMQFSTFPILISLRNALFCPTYRYYNVFANVDD